MLRSAQRYVAPRHASIARLRSHRRCIMAALANTTGAPMQLDDLPRYPLGVLPTPVEKLERIGAELGIDLHAKRDDYTGFAAGGNKIRKLEYLLPDAIAKGATLLITAGGVQSNHARMTAAAAAKCGMKSLLVLRGEKPNAVQGNLLLDTLFGADFDFVAPEIFNTQLDAVMQRHAHAAAQRGERAYLIPVGGSTPLGAMGYVNCIRETAAQYADAGREPPDVIVVTGGSGGTLAGILIGCAMFWPATKVMGVLVTVSPIPYKQRVANAVNAAAEFIGIERRWSTDELWIESDYVGPGYGILTDACVDAIKLAAQREGMLLDPVYTGKTFAGLIGSVRNGKISQGSRVLFVHTGGSPALYQYAPQLV